MERDALLADIRKDLAVAREGMAYLAPRARMAVRLAHDLFLALVVKLERTPAAELVGRRVRVPGYQKVFIALGVCAAMVGADNRTDVGAVPS